MHCVLEVQTLRLLFEMTICRVGQSKVRSSIVSAFGSLSFLPIQGVGVAVPPLYSSCIVYQRWEIVNARVVDCCKPLCGTHMVTNSCIPEKFSLTANNSSVRLHVFRFGVFTLCRTPYNNHMVT